MWTNISHISRAHITKNKRCFNVKSSTYYLHIKAKILTDFRICTSVPLNLLWRRPLPYRNQSIDLQSKSIDWFLYDNGLRHERMTIKRTLTVKREGGVCIHNPKDCSPVPANTQRCFTQRCFKLVYRKLRIKAFPLNIDSIQDLWSIRYLAISNFFHGSLDSFCLELIRPLEEKTQQTLTYLKQQKR